MVQQRQGDACWGWPQFACQYFCNFVLAEHQMVSYVAGSSAVVCTRRLHTAQHMPAAASMVDDVVAELRTAGRCAAARFAEYTQRAQFFAESLRHLLRPGHGAVTCGMAIEQARCTGVDELV